MDSLLDYFGIQGCSMVQYLWTFDYLSYTVYVFKCKFTQKPHM